LDFPSIWLRALGALLILIGLFGSAAGIYALTLVGSYSAQVAPGAMDVKTEITDLSSTLKSKKTDFGASIDDATQGLESASRGIEKSGAQIDSAAASVDKASKNLSSASAGLSQSAALDAQAGEYLKGASVGLDTWAENYEYNGSPLPDKVLFQEATENMSKAADKLKESSAKTTEASDSIDGTAESLQETATELKDTGTELQGVGDKLDDTGVGIGKIKGPIVSLISDVIAPLESSARSTRLVSDLASNARAWAYVVLGYFVLVHWIFIGLGIALIILEVNLSYTM